ncbi:MAG: 5-(carboxyamino)imidazole ribonucleotide mutase [Candidatus Marinamargulisbacteria bacterium]
MKNKVSILMGSKSDLDIMNKAVDVLKSFNIDYDINVLSAHRTPHETIAFVESSDSDIFIAGAGGAAHLPGVVAGITTKPVIGVPVKASISIAGIDSLLSIVQMPPGVPVATVGVDGAKNAGILAVQMLGIANQTVQNQLIAFKKEQREMVLDSNNALVR